MLRTQIYLAPSQLVVLKRTALEENISLSETIRRLVDEKLKEKKPQKKNQNVGDWLLSLARKAKKLKTKGPKDLASRLDYYLYGAKE